MSASGQPMTIALLAAASSVHTMRWANAFVERGHMVHLISQHASGPGLDPRVVVHGLPHLGGLGYLLNGWRVARLLARIKPDVVNAHYATGYGTLAGWCGRVPLVLNVWGSDVFEFPDASALHRRLLLRNLRRADRIVSTSGMMARRVRSFARSLPPITVVPFGVDVERFMPATEAHCGDVVIGTVKTLAPKYGVDTLLRAFALLVANGHQGVQAHIVGGGPDRDALEQLARELAVGAQVSFTGPISHDRVPDALRGMDLFVALSRADSETFGVAVIEASACGLPVVVSDAGGLPEVVLDGVTGFVVPRNDPETAFRRLDELVRSPDLRQRMGQAGRAHVEAKYAWQACVDRQLDTFDRAIRREA